MDEPLVSGRSRPINKTMVGVGVAIGVVVTVVVVATTLIFTLPQATAPLQHQPITINEVVPYPSTGEKAWFELYNAGPTTQDLSGYAIACAQPGHVHQGYEIILPQGSSIKSGGYLVAEFPDDSLVYQLDAGTIALLDPTLEVELDRMSFYASNEATGKAYARLPDGGLWSESLLTASAKGPNKASSTPLWQGGFEIHLLDVGQGDSQLIIFPNGYTLVVDASEQNWNSGKSADGVAAKIKQITGKTVIDALVISHLHLDHLGYVNYGGVWSLIEEQGLTVKLVVDRNAGKWKDANNDGLCTANEIQYTYAGTTSGTCENWLCYATNPKNSKIYDVRRVSELCSTTLIDPKYPGAVVQIVTADGIGVLTKDGEPLAADYTTSSLPPSENGYSLGLLISFGDFRYATFGDLDGEYAESSFGYTYNDAETVVAPRVGQVDIYRANHHGSGHSSNRVFVDTLNPQVSLISCGIDNDYGHPDQPVLDRLLDKGDVYLTNLCNQERSYQHSQIANGDIVVRVDESGTAFTVGGLFGSSSYKTRTPPTNLQCP